MISLTISSKAFSAAIIAALERDNKLFKVTFRAKTVTFEQTEQVARCSCLVTEKQEVMINREALNRLLMILGLFADQPVGMVVDPEDKNNPFTIVNAVV